MRILVTGVTTRETGQVKRELRIKWCPVLDEYVHLFRELGHQVDQRPVTVGEDLSNYDVVWGAMMSLTSMASFWSPGLLWAMRETVHGHTRMVIYPDDWQTPRVAKDFNTIALVGRKQLLKRWVKADAPFYKGLADATDDQIDGMIEAARQFGDTTSELWKNSVLGLSTFDGWGDSQILIDSLGLDGAETHTFDISPVFLRRYGSQAPSTEQDRERRWMLCGLSDAHLIWAKRQQLTWGVDNFGPGKKAIMVLGDEIEVMNAYARHWGALVPKYPHSGSGWFRPRWLTAAMAGTPVLADVLDRQALGGPYIHGTQFMESLSDDGLADLAKSQQEWLWDHVSHDIDVLTLDLNYALVNAAGR